MNTSHSDDFPKRQEPAPLLKKLWLGLFILMYPIIVTFSLLFTGLLLVFSTLSKVISKIVEWLTPRKTPAATAHSGMVSRETEGTAATPVE
jgi:hypothetical protein